MRYLNLFLMAEASSETGVFVGLVVFVVVLGAGLVIWSRRRGTPAGGDAALASAEVSDGVEAKAETEVKVPEAVEEAVPEGPELLPLGTTIRDGLEKTRTQGFISRLAGVFRKELDENFEERLEEVLLTSDIGVKTAQKLLATIKGELSRAQLKDPGRVWATLKDEVSSILETAPMAVEPQGTHPWVTIVVGVNGTGKTTTIGKLAAHRRAQGRKVLLVAADTFRAAAVDQLAIWAERSGAAFHRGRENQDPASVAFDGIRQGLKDEVDEIIVDTAGRLHTARNLVDELKKIVKVCGKAYEGAPHETLLVLDATTGQNAIQQANIFRGEVGVQGIVLTKLDGTAKGGVIIGICDMLQIPVKYVGLGEKVEDLQPFSAPDFVEGLFSGVN